MNLDEPPEGSSMELERSGGARHHRLPRDGGNCSDAEAQRSERELVHEHPGDACRLSGRHERNRGCTLDENRRSRFYAQGSGPG
jgi:hypothetical protein